MDEAPDRNPASGETPYLKLLWPLVAGALFALLAVALAAGIYANRNLRQPPPALVPPTSTAIASAPVTTLVATPAPLVILLTATPESTPRPTSTLVLPDQTRSATPSPVTVGTASPTLTAAVVEEISRAYEQYWQVRAEALLTLDNSHLNEVMAGDHLASVERLLQQLKAEGRAIETDVQHSYVVVQAAVGEGQVVDTYVDNSIYLNAQTHVAVSKPTGESLKELYRMTRMDGRWRVVSLVRSP